MRNLVMSLAAASMAVPVSFALPVVGATKADARTYSSRSTYKRCRYSKGTTGLVAGGVAGAVVGSKVIGGGIVGPIAGAVGGALAGRAVDRTITAKKRCTTYRR